MTTEERVLRLENAFATLSELAAQEKSRTDAVLQLVRQHDESMKAEAARTDTLLQLVHDHDARSETQMTWINSLGSHMEELAAAQARLSEAQAQTEANLSALTVIVQELGQAQKQTDERLNRLSETVERYISEGRNGQGS